MHGGFVYIIVIIGTVNYIRTEAFAKNTPFLDGNIANSSQFAHYNAEWSALSH